MDEEKIEEQIEKAESRYFEVLLEKEYSSLKGKDKTIFNIFLYDTEVRNGGIDQYLSNSSGKHASDAVEALRLVKATAAANCLQEVMTRFPFYREVKFLKLGEKETSFIGELTSAYFEYEPTPIWLLGEFLVGQ